MKYKLLALDVDGTLLDSEHRINNETITAIHEAQDAGLALCLATGRSYIETIAIWRELNLKAPHQPMILIGGALVSEPQTGKTLYQQTIPLAAASEFADALGKAGYSAMAIVDSYRHDVDYFLCEQGNIHSAQRDWFSKMNVRIRRVKRLDDVEDMPEPLRISAVVPNDKAADTAAMLKSRFDGQLSIHAILAPNYGVMIVEAFATGADKFSALSYIARTMQIDHREIAAVGDDVNDLAMIRGVGLGAAMPNAPVEVKDAADECLEGSLAEFIRRLIR